MQYKAVLYDMDGVVNRQPEYFSRYYARQQGLDEAKLETFFDAEFLKASVGKVDLKELIVKRNDLWQWNGAPEDLLQQWFVFENAPDQALVEVIRAQRANGIRVYLATIQEQYRAAYIKSDMFPDLFNAIFASSDLGYHKSETKFFTTILEHLNIDIPGILPSEVAYFDDNQEGLTTASELGIVTYVYESFEQVKAVVG